MLQVMHHSSAAGHKNKSNENIITQLEMTLGLLVMTGQ
jgi:hypothetical protein